MAPNGQGVERALVFVRHGKTKGNLEGRYVGRTDEPLLAESVERLKEISCSERCVIVKGDCTLPRAELSLLEAEREFPRTELGFPRTKRGFPRIELVVSSPMLRCRQTAEILYPETPLWVQEGLEEMDFGDFEYHNYRELAHNPEYQAYIDSGGQRTFPHGEPLEVFRRRCCKAFLKAMEEAGKRNAQSVAFVVHGGTIMAILEAFGEPQRPYFDWQVKNAESIAGTYREGRIWTETVTDR